MYIIYSLSLSLFTALSELYANVVLASLNPLIYPAILLDYSVSVKAVPHGLNIAINGYSDSAVMNNIIELVVNGTSKNIPYGGKFWRELNLANCQNLVIGKF